MIFDIPKGLWVRVQDSNADIVFAGYFDNSLDKILKNIKVGFFKNGSNGLFRVRLHTTKNFNRNFAASDWVDFSKITEKMIVGNVRFDFTKQVNLLKNNRYYVTIEASSYVRNADVSYVGWLQDSPFPTNVSTGNYPTEFPIKMEFFAK